MRKPWSRLSFPEFQGETLITPINDELVDEYVNALNKIHSKRIRRERRLEEATFKKLERKFRRFIRLYQKASISFPESLDHRSELVHTHAHSLLRSKSLHLNIGPFVTQYVVNESIVSAYFSMDSGITLQKIMEIEIRGSMQNYVEQICELMDQISNLLIESIKTEKLPQINSLESDSYSNFQSYREMGFFNKKVN